MSVGVMEDYKLRDLRASHTLGAIGGRRPQEEESYNIVVYYETMKRKLI